MSENFDIKVGIRQDLLKNLIFGLQARLPIGIILGFLDYKHKVTPLLQSLSHSTRAYIFNADGLQGFLKELSQGRLKAIKEAK